MVHPDKNALTAKDAKDAKESHIEFGNNVTQLLANLYWQPSR